MAAVRLTRQCLTLLYDTVSIPGMEEPRWTLDELARLARLPATGPPAPGRVVPAAAPAGGADAARAVAAAPRGPRPAAFWHERPTAALPAAPLPPGAPGA